LDRQLANHEFVAGDFYSIADMSIWGWASLWEGQQQTLDDKPNLKRWLDTVTARTGVQKGRAVAAEKRGDYKGDKTAQDTLFKRS
jgi:GST-like protein